MKQFRETKMLSSCNDRYSFQPRHFRLAHDISLDCYGSINDADETFMYECNNKNSTTHSDRSNQLLYGNTLVTLNQKNDEKSKFIPCQRLFHDLKNEKETKLLKNLQGLRIEDLATIGIDSTISTSRKASHNKRIHEVNKTKFDALPSRIVQCDKAEMKVGRWTSRKLQNLPSDVENLKSCEEFSLAEELQAAIVAENESGNVEMLDGMEFCSYPPLNCYSHSELGSPEQIDPITKYNDVYNELSMVQTNQRIFIEKCTNLSYEDENCSAYNRERRKSCCLFDDEESVSYLTRVKKKCVFESAKDNVETPFPHKSSIIDISSNFTSDQNVLTELMEADATHRGCHKFLPRHSDELQIEIGDPIFVDIEADDLWCEGINLKTKRRGIFPTAYATDLSILDEGVPEFKFYVKFLGSIEVNYHQGNEVLCQAIYKLLVTKQSTSSRSVHCLIEINDFGIKMSEISQPIPVASTNQVNKKLYHKQNSDHFFSLKNISFCGYHPKNEKYFGFITKHPIEMRFACHVFESNKSSKPLAESIGEAFRRFYQEYLARVYPTEDIYIE